MRPLEKLENLDPRKQWTDESTKFTPWVSSPEGLQLIGETLNLELETLSSSSEVHVGRFRADVVCIDTSEPDDSLVLIENQLNHTDHEHVGQVLTYAAGLDAVTIIWIATKFREEHTAVIEWLNRITNERYRFFGLEIGLVKIGDCGPAATFSIVAKPNDWSRRRTEPVRHITETERLHLKFWTAFIEDAEIKNKSPRPLQRFSVGVGSRFANISALRMVTSRSLKVELYLPGAMRDHYMVALVDQQDEIEDQLGLQVEFVRRPKTNSVAVTVNKDPLDEGDWPAQIKWFKDMLAKFDRVFRDRIQGIAPEDWEDEVEQLDSPD